MIQTIHGEIWSDNFSVLHRLTQTFCSCMRSSFSCFQKDKLNLNEVRNVVKKNYSNLNIRYIYDAVNEAEGLYKKEGDKKVVFGSRKLWNKLKNKIILKEEWREARDNQIYSRGEKSKKGNLNCRIIEYKNILFLRINYGIRMWVYYRLYIPKKYKDRLNYVLNSGIAYNVRLKRKDKEHYKIIIDYEAIEPYVIITLENGAIGVDVNPDRVAIVEVNKEGNLINSFTIINTKIYYSRHNKRSYEIGCVVKQIIDYANQVNKGIIFENLQFDKEFKDEGKRFNKIKSNFGWHKLLSLLECKCIENGIEYKKVNPAFTSVIGKLKYTKLYNLSIHESASYVIARRGLGFNEKLSLYKYPPKLVKEEVIRTLEGKYNNKRIHSWVLWRTLRDNLKAVLTGLQSRMINLQELVDSG